MTSQNLQTVRGYISALPRVKQSEETARVAITTDEGKDFQVIHKGVGTDLADHVSANVEVQGIISEQGENVHIYVRTYKIADDWCDD